MSSLTTCLLIVQALLSTDRARIREEMLWRTFKAVAWVESSGDPRSHNRKEDALGIVQLRAIAVRECNRILGKPKYSLADRLSVEKSWEMFRLLSRYHENQGGPEEWCRAWNAGPDWRKNRGATDAYWAKCRAAMSR